MKKKLFAGVGIASVLLIAVTVMGAVTWQYPLLGGMTKGSIMYASDTAHLQEIAAVASGQVLASAGTSTKPAYTTSPSLTALTGAGTGQLKGFTRYVGSAASSTTAVTAAQSGGTLFNTGTSSTTTFTLPAAAAGLNYCFVEAGDAAGELLINTTGTNTVVGKIHGAENATGIATASSTGIKNTAATNVKGDFTCLTALNTTTWYMTAVAGVWATQ